MVDRRGPDLHAPTDEAFRAEVRAWLSEHLTGEFAELRGCGGPGRDHEASTSGSAGSGCSASTAGSASAGRRSTAAAALTLAQQVIFHEEYARADAPGRVGHFGEGLLGPTLIAFGTEEQKQRFLPKIVAGRGAVVPGLLRAERRLRPRQRADQGAGSTATSG